MISPVAQETAEHLLESALLSESGDVQLELTGDCMSPFLRAGDKARFASSLLELSPGHLVLARNPGGELVCHRVVACNNGDLWLAGDSTLAVAKHSRDQVLGRVVTIRRATGDVHLPVAPSLVDRLFAFLHWRSIRCQGTFTGRLLEALRRRLLHIRTPAGPP